MSNQTPAPEKLGARRAPIALWRSAGAFLATLYALFGSASEVAESHTLTSKARALMLAWLGAGEALVRRLLLIEASLYMREELPATRERQPRERDRKRIAFDPAKPEEWRVAFRFCLDRRRPRRRDAGGPRQRAPARFHSAWPLAERYEALIRAYNDPAPYARRLARRLYAEPRRAAALIAYTPPSKVSREGFEDTQTAAERAQAHFRDSS
jgi:hypothetical protein